MTRLCLALITALYAIAFAFLAIMAVRWPSVLAIAALLSDNTSGTADVGALINWRQLGLFYGGLYLFAAMCFYACSTLIQRKTRGAVTAFTLGLLAGFPFLTLFDFSANWWQAPNMFEQITIGAVIFSLFLIPAIRAVTPHKKPKQVGGKPASLAAAPQSAQPVQPVSQPQPTQTQPTQPKRRRKPIPAAIARQRESFAYHGRRALARRAG